MSDDVWHPLAVRNIYANFIARASQGEDYLKCLIDAAAAIYEASEFDEDIDGLCEMAAARGLDDDAIQACLVKARDRAVVGLNGKRLRDVTGLFQGAIEDENYEPLEAFDAFEWNGYEEADRKWLTTGPDQIPLGEPGILSGDGGVGKTIIALQLAVAVALGWPDWLGKILEHHGPVIVYSVEEKLKELHRRTRRILASRRIENYPQGRLFFISDPAEPILARYDNKADVVRPTKTLHRLQKLADLHKPKLVVVENAADVFSGNENSREQVHPFVRQHLGGLCRDGETTMMLLQHPSVSGLIDKTGRSGSTGWNNAGRWRLNFTYAGEQNGGEDDGARQLQLVKCNYARHGEKIKLRWKDGIFTPESFTAIDVEAQSAFLDCLDEFERQGRYVSPNKGPTHAPTLFAQSSAGHKIGKTRLDRAMYTLLEEHRITVAPNPSKPPAHAGQVVLRA